MVQMDRENLLIERLKRYSASNAAAFHMPGHKRQMKYGFLRDFPDPFSIDITEIDGFDNLHHPEGILKDSMEWMAGVYGADHSYYLVNGSSCGILSAIGAAVRPGETILVSRNCHKAVYHGLILNFLKPEYVYPQIMGKLGIQGGIRPENVENKLREHPEIRAVLIVSPTYDGVVSDVEKIAEVVHAKGIPLIVDEAHGAHFPFGAGKFPKSALYCGADVVIQSLHKTLPSLTQTAILHLNGKLVDQKRLERCLQMYQTSSPSYVFMASMEQCIFEMQQNGRAYMTAFAERIQRIRIQLAHLTHLRLLRREEQGRHGVFDIDESKVVISCRGFMTGEELSGRLRREYEIEMEMCGADYVVAITTFLDSEEHLERLKDALLEIDGKMKASRCTVTDPRKQKNCGVNHEMNDEQLPEICMTPFAAFHAPTECIRLEDSAGRISGEFIYLYPPGIPIVTPGEKMTENIIDRVLYDRSIGLPVQGLEDPDIKYLKVIRTE